MGKLRVTVNNLLKPMGKGASAVSLKPLIESLTVKYYKNIASDIKIYSFITGDKKKEYYIYSKVPSEQNSTNSKDVYYDVILQFYPKNSTDEGLMSFESYFLKVFSNCPSFTFTFTYTFKSIGGLVDFIPNKYYSKEALKENAKERNPNGLLGIEKSIWYTLKKMKMDGLFRKSRMSLIAISSEKVRKLQDFLKFISSQDDKLDEVTKVRRLNNIKKKKHKPSVKKSKSVLKTMKLKSQRLSKLKNRLVLK